MAFDLQNITLTDIIVAIFLAGVGYGKIRTMVRRNGNGHGTWAEVIEAMQGVVDALGKLRGSERVILQELRDHNASADEKWSDVNRTLGGQGRALASIKTTAEAIQGQINALFTKQ